MLRDGEIINQICDDDDGDDGDEKTTFSKPCMWNVKLID